MELPLVLEVPSGHHCEDDVQLYFDTYDPVDHPRAMSLIVFDISGAETFRWNLYEFTPDGYTAGFEGTRFTFVQSQAPISGSNPRYLGLQRGDNNAFMFGTADAYNPATDKGVELPVNAGLYPAVVEQTDRRLVLEYDYAEGGGIWQYVAETALYGTAPYAKSSFGVITYDTNVVEIGRVNYFGCFPVKYEHFAGFAQDIQGKERVTIHCDFSEPAQ